MFNVGPTFTPQPAHLSMSRSTSSTRLPWLSVAGLLSMLLGIVMMSGAPSLAQDEPVDPAAPLVYVIPVQGTIEPGLGAFFERSLNEAHEAGATAIIFDINTPGGRLDTVLEMRDQILGSEIQTIAFVNREAFSAGALITIASHQIWMAPGGVFGAATPVMGGTGEAADEKTISAVRSTFRATAQERGRDPVIAEAMVDPAVAIDGLDTSTSLLTLTVEQAREWDYAEGIAANRPALLDALGLADATIVEMSLSPAEQLARWITDPLFASLLIMAGLILIVGDVLFAATGIGALIGAACLGVFFWGHTVAGLAGWEDLVLIAIGLVLIAVEIFILPGLGIAGIAGAISLAGGLVLAMSGRGIRNFELTDEVIEATWMVAISLAVVLVAMIGISILMAGRTGHAVRRFGGLSLSATVDEDGPITSGRTARQPGWLVRQFGGSGVLEAGTDQRMPAAPGQEEDRQTRT